MSSNSVQPAQNSQSIKNIASLCGFMYCGLSEANFLEQEAPRLESWLNKGNHGSMKWMEGHFDKRLDPRLLMPGAKSVISVLYNYYPSQFQNADSFYKISKYAYGQDYHQLLKAKLAHFSDLLTNEIGSFEARAFVDSAPVMDKVWAQKSGLGWIGKHTNLIRAGVGSYFFIAELITDIAVVPDGPVADFCGTCTKCIEACPTDALQPYQIDASKCISYLTIELRDAIPEQFKNSMERWIFGCDICQDVCPWNRFAEPHQEPGFAPNPAILEFTKHDWEHISEEVFNDLFKKSAIKRAKLEGLRRNIQFAGA